MVEITSNSVIVKIKYSDLDNVVDKITIHDKNGNINDVVLLPSDLNNDEYEIKKLKTGDYQLELTLHWTSLNDNNNVISNEFVEFNFKNPNIKWIYIFSILLIIIILLILFILYMIKRRRALHKDDELNDNKMEQDNAEQY